MKILRINIILNLPRVYSIAGRTAQHISCAKLLKDIVYDKNLISEFILAYLRLYIKTLFLICLNAGYNYKKTDLKNKEIMDKIEKSMNYINKENEKFYQLLQDYEKKSGISLELFALEKKIRNIENEYEKFIKDINLTFLNE